LFEFIHSSGPVALDNGQLVDLTGDAIGLVLEENRFGGSAAADPGRDSRSGVLVSSTVMEGLKKRHPFLREYSDEELSKYSMETVLKLEATSIKLKNLEKSRSIEEKLAANRDALHETEIQVKEGVDNRMTKIHDARYLPGMTCSSAKMWEGGRRVIGNNGHPPVATYDMKSVGLAGYVTPQGWAALHNPGCSNISLKMFSIINCGRKVQTKGGEGDDNLTEVAETGEFKVALRVLREASAMVNPWNKSISAIEGFMFQNNFMAKDLEGVEKQGLLLSQFVDYVLRENSNRWNGQENFLSIEELKGAWESFYGARPQSMLSKSKRPGQQAGGQGQGQHHGQPIQQRGGGAFSNKIHPSLFYDDICVMWNVGRCTKAPGNCFTKNGKALRHVCNFRPDYTKQMPACGQNHASCFFH